MLLGTTDLKRKKGHGVWSHLYVESNEQYKPINKIGPEAWTHGTAWQISEGTRVGGTAID